MTLAQAAFTTAMQTTGYPADIWARRTYFVGDKRKCNYLHRGEESIMRAHVWWLMRQPQVGGVVLSYPEIAQATLCASHSKIIYGVRRHALTLKNQPGALPGNRGVDSC